jgi:hypothetical protein
MKQLFLQLSIPLIFLVGFTGCQEQSQTQRNSKYFMREGVFSIEMERYENKEYGYAITVPRSWGTHNEYGYFSDDLTDNTGEIGPLTGSAAVQTIKIEVFSDENATRKPNQSWIDFYMNLRLTGTKYDKSSLSGIYAEIIRYNNDEKYKDTCRLYDHKNKLYVFCYHKDNNIHWDIIKSIELK